MKNNLNLLGSSTPTGRKNGMINVGYEIEDNEKEVIEWQDSPRKKELKKTTSVPA